MRARQDVSRLALAAGLAMAAPALAQVVGPNGQPVYPQGEPLSRAMTPLEQEWSARNPYVPGSGTDVPSAPPTGPVHCVAEYEPMDGIIIGWEGGHSAIHAEMARRITTTGDADLYISCDNASVQASATTYLTNAGGVNMSRVKFIIRTLDGVWMRDYGPRYIYEGDCRAIIDHKYNRPTRLQDDVFPQGFAQYKKHAIYELGMNGTTLVHGGGNYHLDALGFGYATRLINNENPWFTEPQIISVWDGYQNLDTVLFTPFPTFVDATQHIDMWVQVIADNKVIISDWPNNAGSTQDQICDNAAVFMAGAGFTVYRVPAFSISGTHYTFTNMVMCNDIVMIPSYTHATVAPHNAAALATLQAALPTKTIYQVPCQNIIGLAGAIHCIVMHVPEHRGLPGAFGGLAPTTYLKSPNGGQSLTPGQNFEIRWISDDDAAVANVDILLSTDGGATFPTSIASAIADTGLHNWVVPALNTAQARVRVMARDALGNTGGDASDADFTIGTPGAPCYANCDASTTAPVLNVADFTCFLQKFAAGDASANCDASTAAPVLNVADFTCFLQAFAAGCP